jgi:hypothetical protein
MGDSIGWWEGDTLVVETTNFRPDNAFRGATSDQKVIERFTRISPQQIDYKFEIVDPSAYTAVVKGEEALNFTKTRSTNTPATRGTTPCAGILAGGPRGREGRQTLTGGDGREEGN